jgi:hypothetical protein
VRGHFLKNFYVLGRQEFLAPFFKNFKVAVIWESFDWFAVIFELGFLLVLFRKKYMRLYIMLGMIFHIANTLILNIAFIDNFPVYVLFFPFVLVYDEADINYSAEKFFKRSVFFIAILFFAFLFFFIDQSITVYALSSAMGIAKQTVDLSLMAGLLFIYTFGLALNSSPRDETSYNTNNVLLSVKP